jgi:MSHA biogenesis protein MshJ
MSYLTALQEKIDSSSLRERALIFVTLLAGLLIVWNLSLQSLVDKQEQIINAEMAAVATEQASVDMQISTLQMASVNSRYKEKNADVEALMQSISQVELQLSSLSQGLISAEQLPRALKDMFEQGSTLNLLSVKTFPAEELKVATIQSPDMAEQTVLMGSGVFKHSVVIEVLGSYSQLLKLLNSMESLTWKFYWESLDYEVVAYPNARIRLRVFTLSSEEGLLGV